MANTQNGKRWVAYMLLYKSNLFYWLILPWYLSPTFYLHRILKKVVVNQNPSYSVVCFELKGNSSGNYTDHRIPKYTNVLWLTFFWDSKCLMQKEIRKKRRMVIRRRHSLLHSNTTFNKNNIDRFFLMYR